MSNPLSNLRNRRLQLNVDPKLLAQAIGVDVRSYYRFENGGRRIYLDKALLLAQLLECTVEDLGQDTAPVRRQVDGTVVTIEPAIPEGWDMPD